MRGFSELVNIFDNPESLIGRTIKHYTLVDCIGKGANGVVYKAIRKDIGDTAAIKIIPEERLYNNWDIELKKAVKLQGIEQFVQYRTHFFTKLDGANYVVILSEYVNGLNLKDYARQYYKEITMAFVKNLSTQILKAIFAMQHESIRHEDLYENNILIAKDNRVPDEAPRIRITDFGTGFKSSTWDPSDDYLQLAIICQRLLSDYIDPANLDPDDTFVYEQFVNVFLKMLLERNPTAEVFEQDCKKLIDYVEGLKKVPVSHELSLRNPFDYLNCEQIGNSFELLSMLYSKNFLGYQDLTQRSNTILTGPRGCGKSTIFKNLSLKTQVLAGKLNPDNLEDFIGVYYQCSDLYYAFPYLERLPTEEDKRAIVHYFNLGVLFEVLDTFSALEKVPQLSLERRSLSVLDAFLCECLSCYQSPPSGTNILNHLKSLVITEKTILKKWLDSGRTLIRPEVFLPIDFLKNLCVLLENSVPWLKGRVFYFFIDDYSLPRISRTVQIALSDFILDRNSECFYKISTESVTTLCTVDSHGKLLEETREYDLIDLGGYFLNADLGKRKSFLREIVNNRLSIAAKKYSGVNDVEAVLGKTPYSYNELAVMIRTAKTRVYYCGWDLIVDLCSGDIAIFLRMIRDIFTLCIDRSKETEQFCIDSASPKIQDQAIRSNANDFLNRIETAPGNGKMLRKIAESFGDVASWYLVNLNSGNQKTNPPRQAFRIEVRETPELSETSQLIYNDLLKYSVFLRDVRGKSQRSAVVPRLYLRRLLIPSFRLTPSQRDSIGMEPEEFNLLIEKPSRFSEKMKSKKHSVRSDRWQTTLKI
jgi:serine/threonine protein kinase